MGVVYRAHDTKLGRDVAIKALPDAFASDADRLLRFQREAQVLASLNHPNIAQIYGLEESDKTRCIVMELVEGQTLQERLKRGPIPLEEALPIASQIATALEAAHERGIIHRDLKPANIKLTPDGTVKVLDFGLARINEASGDPTNLSNSPTLISAASTPGMIMGTAAYMAPEQAKGFPADQRSDVFSFGCILYEMLTGTSTFSGDTTSEILASVLKSEPDLNLLPAKLNPRLREALQRTLSKNPKQRFHAIADVRFEIEQALRKPLEVAPPVVMPTGKPGLAWIAALGAAGVLIVILAIPALRYLRETSPPETRVEVNTPDTPQPLHFAISPDGRQLVFVAYGDGSQKLWVRPLDASMARPLAGTDGAEFPFWSPDGHSIGFFASAKMKRVDIGGGPPQLIADAASGRGGTWNRDGTIVFAPTAASPLWRVAATAGQPVQVTRFDLPRQGSHRFPQFLPDGKHFLFFSQGSPDTQGIYLGSLDNSETKRLIPSDSAGGYVEPGWLLFNRQGALVARRLNVTRAELEGEPVTVADSVSFDTGFNLGGFSVSSFGNVAYRAGALERRQLKWFDRTGRVLSEVGEPDVNLLEAVELSPDERRVAVSRTLQDNRDIWLVDLARGTRTRLTFDAASDHLGSWSPDGAQIAFQSNRKGNYDLYIKPSSGAGAEQPLLESSHVKMVMDWSRDGRYVLYNDGDPKTGYDLWALPVQGDRKPLLVVNTPFEERLSQFSPDGRWVAYQSNESGRFEIYVQPFPMPGGKWQVSTAGGTAPRWRHDGKELFFMAPDGKLMAASVQVSGSTFESASPVVLFQTRAATGGNANIKPQYDVSRDGRFLINTVIETATVPISLILNWHPERGK
jgi:serine/threonine protein kinase/Tol biopolymer transport system component